MQTGGFTLSLVLISCGTKRAAIVIDYGSVPPGSQITRKGEKLPLIGTAIEVGQRLPNTLCRRS